MNRSLISWNIPNLITVPLMAILGWFLLVVIWQLVRRGIGMKGNGETASTDGGY